MANFIVSYDLNGPVPSHAQMDEHLTRLPNATTGRILESVWYVGYPGSAEDLFKYVQQILQKSDRLAVVAGVGMMWQSLLVTDQAMKAAWEKNQYP